MTFEEYCFSLFSPAMNQSRPVRPTKIQTPVKNMNNSNNQPSHSPVQLSTSLPAFIQP